MPPSSTLLIRSFVVLVCYVLSTVGILFMLIAGAETLRHDRYGWLVAGVWCLAWLIHLALAIGWVVNHRLHPAWANLGVILGVLSFAAPAFAAAGAKTWDGVFMLTGGAAFLASIEVLFLLPSVLLALKLVSFHSASARMSSLRSEA